MIHWRYLTGDGESAAEALAADEFLMSSYADWEERNYPEPTLRIYTYRSHCAIVGRFQNTEAEVNLPACADLDVEVNRRMTGGGAAIMGKNQLMVALASSAEHPSIPAHPARILPKLARGVIAGLEQLGIQAEYRPKNDIVVNGRKIGGTALCVDESGAFLYHATVLVDFDVPLMLKTLNIPAEKLSDKTAASHEERMTSMTRELGHSVDMDQAREAVCRGFEQAFRMSATHLPFRAMEIEKIEQLERGKYRSREWVFHRLPAPDMAGSSIGKTPGGLIRAYVALAGDTIKSVLITGDFSSGDRIVRDIEAALKWSKADRDAIARTIRVVMKSSSESIQGADSDELADIISNAVTSARSIV